MTVPDLPLELVTLILEDLYEPLSSISPNEPPDKSALRACRLVCRSWATLAAKQLFRAIYFSFCTAIEDAWQMVDGLYPPLPGRWMRDHHGKKWPLKTLEGFHDFFASRDDLRLHARSVLLRGYTSDDWNVGKREVPAQLFVKTVNILQHLQILRIINVTISGESPTTGQEPDNVTRTLDRLTIHSPFDMRANLHLLRLLRRFTAVDELHLSPDILEEDSSEEPVAAQATPLAVRALRVQSHDGIFMRDLARLLDLGKLRKLSVCDAPPGDTFEAIQNFIYASSALEYLQYTFSLDTLLHSANAPIVPDFFRSPSLKSIVLGTGIPGLDNSVVADDELILSAYAKVLQNAHLESLGAHKLILRIRRKSMRSLQDGSQLTPLNNALDDMRRQWGTLKEIWIMCEKEEDEHARTSIAGHIRLLLPQPSMNCVLRVLFAQQPMELPPVADIVVTRL